MRGPARGRAASSRRTSLESPAPVPASATTPQTRRETCTRSSDPCAVGSRTSNGATSRSSGTTTSARDEAASSTVNPDPTPHKYVPRRREGTRARADGEPRGRDTTAILLAEDRSRAARDMNVELPERIYRARHQGTRPDQLERVWTTRLASSARLGQDHSKPRRSCGTEIPRRIARRPVRPSGVVTPGMRGL